LHLSQIFETAYWQRLGDVDHEAFLDILKNFETMALINPRMIGVPHPELPNIWVYESPRLTRFPPIVIIYTVNDDTGMVILWNVRLLDR